MSRTASLSGVRPADLCGTQPPLLLTNNKPMIAHIQIFGAAACRRLSCAGCRSAAGSWTRKQSSQGADPATGVMQPYGTVQLAFSSIIVGVGRPCTAAAASQCAALCAFALLEPTVWMGCQSGHVLWVSCLLGGNSCNVISRSQVLECASNVICQQQLQALCAAARSADIKPDSDDGPWPAGSSCSGQIRCAWRGNVPCRT